MEMKYKGAWHDIFVFEKWYEEIMYKYLFLVHSFLRGLRKNTFGKSHRESRKDCNVYVVLYTQVVKDEN